MTTSWTSTSKSRTRFAAAAAAPAFSSSAWADKIVDIDEFFDFPQGLPRRETGLRVDRIVIVGPPGSDGFIEHLIVRQTSVFGKIDIEDVEIQNLILKDVTLDDGL